jgi:hypothetical protein
MDAHETLLAAIGRALGLDGPYPEIVGEREEAINLGNMTSAPITKSLEVLGGAVCSSTGRVAWVEQRSDVPVDGYVPVEIDLRFAWDGALQAITEPYFYNPFFGCRVHLAGWFGERFVLLYREKHDMMLCAFDPPYGRRPDAAFDDEDDAPADDDAAPPSGPETSVRVEDSIALTPDAVWYLAERGALVLGRRLPSLARTVVVLPPEVERYPLFWIDTDGRARVAPRPQWSHETETWQAAVERARAAGIAFPLPSLDVVAHLDPPALAERWRRRVVELGLPRSIAGSVVDRVGKPWLRPDEDPHQRYGKPPVLPCAGEDDAETEAIAAALPRIAALDHGRGGWPEAATLDENLDTLFLWSLARAAARTLAGEDE